MKKKEDSIEIAKMSKSIKYEENPFLVDNDEGIVKGMRVGTKGTIVAGTNDILLDSKTSEVKAHSVIISQKEVDRDKFVKIYLTEISALFDLSKTGIRMFSYVMQVLKINKATIYISVQDAIDYCHYKTKSSVYKGLGELISNKIIAMSTRPNLWHINPSIIFNGDRVTFVKDIRVKDKENKEGIQMKIPLSETGE